MTKDQYIQKQLERLQRRKTNLQKRIDEAYTHYADDLQVHYLKVEKLKVKDRIEEIRRLTG